jgi:hypothetical protein
MSRLHRGRKLLQRSLYNHALSLGIVKGEERVGDDADAHPPTRDPAKTANLADYRVRRRGVA